MSGPTEHKTVQVRILEYAEAEGRDIGNWRLECGVSGGELYFGEATNWHGRRQIGERRGDSNSESLSSLCSLRLAISGFRGLNRRERRDRKEDFDWPIWQQAAAKFPGWEFWRRLCQNFVTACRQFLEQAVQEMNRVPEFP